MAGPDTSAFTAVKEKVDLEEYLTEHLGVDLVANGPGRTAALCPFHAEDTPSFMVEDSGEGWKHWRCYGACGEGGTVIDAAMKAEGFELAREAIVFLDDLYGLELDINMSSFREFAEAVAHAESDIRESREAIQSDSGKAAVAKQYLVNRGLSEEAIDHFQLGLDTSLTKSGRVSIPLFDKANHPVSIAKRALFDEYDCQACGETVAVKQIAKQRHQAKRKEKAGESDVEWKFCPHCKAPDREAKIGWLIGQNPKYRFTGGFEAAEFLYNENEARKLLNKDETVSGLFLSEGYGEVWAGWISDNRAFCAYTGSVLSEWQAREVVKLVSRNDKPVILVPDFDGTGIANVDTNIRRLRAEEETLEIQVVYGIDQMKYTDYMGDEVPCKDLGDVLQYFGSDKVAEVLERNRWAAAEWQVRQILGKRNEKTGKPFYSQEKQMQLVAEVLSREHSRKVSLDHLVDHLATVWESPIEAIRTWFYSSLNEDNATSYQHLFKDIEQSRREAREFLQDSNVIPLGFAKLDEQMPGGGARPGQLAMALGKAQPLHSKVLTPEGWMQMGDIVEGQEVVDPIDGSPAVVAAVHPQGIREVHRIQLVDGRSTSADLEHVWLAQVDGIEVTITTKGLIAAASRDADVLLPTTQRVASGLTWVPLGCISLRAAEHTQCIELESESRLYVTDEGIVTHNSGTGKTMLAGQILANIADKNINSIFFSLEQAAKSLYSRLVSQALDMDSKEAEVLIRNHDDDPEIERQLKPVHDLYENMRIIDNVPDETHKALSMTPSRIQAMIQEANLTHFGEDSAQVVIIDHLGIIQVDDDAPRDVKGSDIQAPGYIMQKLFEVCKVTNVFMLVLQQLPKEVPAGKPFPYDAGRGGSKQTDFCDYIFQIYRPEQAEDIKEEDLANVEGEYKIVLGKNRFGGSTVFHGLLDKVTLRIMPQFKAIQPDEVNESPAVPVDDDEEGVPEELRIDEAEEESGSEGDVGRSAHQIEALAEQTNDSPDDSLELLKQIGGQREEGDDGIDPTLGSMIYG